MHHHVLSLAAVVCLCFTPAPPTAVYICTGPNAEVYHYSRNCRGLNSCKHEVRTVTKEKAIELGRRICGWED